MSARTIAPAERRALPVRHHVFACLKAAALLASTAIALDARADVEAGRKLYAHYCARCHGINMISAGNASYDLRRFPTNQGERFKTSVLKGKNAMPAFGDKFGESEIGVLWTYVTNGR